MFTKIKEFLFGKPSTVEAPYKVEAPTPTVELNSIEDGSVVVTLSPQPSVATQNTAPAKKKTPAKKQQFEKKVAAPKTKAPARPRAPKKAPTAK